MLEDYVWPIVSGWENIDELVFMHNGPPPYFALSIRAWLDPKFPGRWLGQRRPHEWPAKSRDLTPCDFFLWGWAKVAYWAKPHTMEQLEDQIRNIITNVPHDFLQKTVDSIGRFRYFCIGNIPFLNAYLLPTHSLDSNIPQVSFY